ncbi:MAG TPA: GNAT family N-acetyltransferase [Lachnospiraceae bacterium]|nr:GNAT family N-acetyltransferase [Lachnospiraceae bacterium]
MRYIMGNDPIFERLISGRYEYVFNLFYLIRSNEDALMITDDCTYIIAQSKRNTPLWIFVNDKANLETEKEIVQIVARQLEEYPKLKVNAEERYITPILNRVSLQTRISYSINMPMNAYACFHVTDIKSKGHMVCPTKEYINDMARLIREMVLDAEKKDIGEQAAINFANSMENSESLHLWKDGKIVSMTRVAHKSNKYARINTVVTERSERCKGYAGMLISEISANLLRENKIPMLYADARNPASNAAYEKIGFIKQGEVTEFVFGGC